MFTITQKIDPETGRFIDPPGGLPIPEIYVDLIPPLEGKLLGKAGYDAMVQFYSDPNNLRRFETWMESQGTPIDRTQIFNPANVDF